MLGMEHASGFSLMGLTFETFSAIIPVSFPPVVSLVILRVLQGHEHGQTPLCVLGQDTEVLSRLRTLLCFVGFTMRICIYEDSVYFMFI